jgi:hypothetical protein
VVGGETVYSSQLDVRNIKYIDLYLHDSFVYSYRGAIGHSGAGSIRSIGKSNDLTENGTRDLPACSIVPQPTTLPLAPYLK